MVNVVKAAGEPIEAPEVRAKFRNAIGSIIRTKMVSDPTIPDWLTVPEGKKEAMWEMLSKTFIYHEELRKELSIMLRRCWVKLSADGRVI
jgi:hypothetical protein